jgi:hypothetical protein
MPVVTCRVVIVLGGDGGRAFGGDGVKEITGMGLGCTHKGGGVSAVDTVGVKVEAPHVVVGDSMAVVQGTAVANKEGSAMRARDGRQSAAGRFRMILLASLPLPCWRLVLQ